MTDAFKHELERVERVARLYAPAIHTQQVTLTLLLLLLLLLPMMMMMMMMMMLHQRRDLISMRTVSRSTPR